MIKDHISNRGQELIRPTSRLVCFWFHRLNHAVFDGQLAVPTDVKIVHDSGHHAWCVPLDREPNYELRFRPNLITREKFLDVLIHEMVHVWQLQNGHTLTHGKTFKCWKRAIHAATGLNLETSYYE